jgi:hypothetical protein
MRKHTINWKQVEILLNAQCSQIEIASYLGISRDSLSDRCKADQKMPWEEYARKHKSHGIAAVRLKHYQKIMKTGDNASIIFWEKNFAGMTDKIQQTITPESEILIRRVVVHKTIDEVRGKESQIDDNEDEE